VIGYLAIERAHSARIAVNGSGNTQPEQALKLLKKQSRGVSIRALRWNGGDQCVVLVWSTSVCDDKVASVQAQIVGDFQGDNEAEIKIALDGGSVMRRCDSEELIQWDIRSAGLAVVQAGVNTFGEATANTSLFGQSVARASWVITIPSGNVSPANGDLDFNTIEDVVLKINHKAFPRQTQSIPLDISCLGTVGAG
jgi:hypothetical protein